MGKRTRAADVRTIDVREIRERMGLTQAEFAERFGFSPAVLRNWEQGRNEPDGAARVLLAVIDRNPEAVEDALLSRPPSGKKPRARKNA